MLLLIFFVLLLIGILLTAGLLWLAVTWLIHEQHECAQEAASRSLTHIIARELETRALWRSLTAWMATKPLRVEDQRGKGA